MDNHKYEKDEYLERLWCMKEDNKDSIDDLMNRVNGSFNEQIIETLEQENLIERVQNDTKIHLTDQGLSKAQLIIRSHRIAERLIYNVLEDEFESGACEFEHIVTLEIVDSICILLGHPRECPHGLPIPE